MERFHQLRGKDAGIGGVVKFGRQHGKLVATEARDGIGLANVRAQSIGHRFQHPIANGMAERIVDILEMIEVEVKHAKEMLVPPRAGGRLLERFQESGAIDQARQSVVAGEVDEIFLNSPAVGDVAHGSKTDHFAAKRRTAQRYLRPKVMPVFCLAMPFE